MQSHSQLQTANQTVLHKALASTGARSTYIVPALKMLILLVERYVWNRISTHHTVDHHSGAFSCSLVLHCSDRRLYCFNKCRTIAFIIIVITISLAIKTRNNSNIRTANNRRQGSTRKCLYIDLSQIKRTQKTVDKNTTVV